MKLEEAIKKAGSVKKGKAIEKGIALIVVLLVLASVSLAGALLLRGTMARNQASAAGDLVEQSISCAEAGGEIGISIVAQDVYAGNDWEAGLGTQIASDTLGTGTLSSGMYSGNFSVTHVDNEPAATEDGDPAVDIDNRTFLQSQCTVNGVISTVNLMGRITQGSLYNGGVCGCLSVDIDGGTDSYDSIAGEYSDTNQSTHGNVMANGDIDFSSATINGNVYSAGNVTGSADVYGSVWAAGSIGPGINTFGGSTHPNSNVPNPCRCDGTSYKGFTLAQIVNDAYDKAIDDPTDPNDEGDNTIPPLDDGDGIVEPGEAFLCGSPSSPPVAGNACCSPAMPLLQCCNDGFIQPINLGDLSSPPDGIDEIRWELDLSGAGDKCSLTTGTYYLNKLDMTGNSEVEIDSRLDPTDFNNWPNDNVRIIFDDIGDLDGDGLIDAGTSEEGGVFKIAGNGINAQTNDTLNLEIISNSIHEIDMSGTPQFSGTLYAPKASFIQSGTAQVYGAIFGKIVSAGGTTDIHFDENLLNRTDFDNSYRGMAGLWRLIR